MKLKSRVWIYRETLKLQRDISQKKLCKLADALQFELLKFDGYYCSHADDQF